MTDAIDQGCQREQEDRDLALSAQAAKPAMTLKGKYYNCEAVIQTGYFCDADCRDDFEKRSKIKGILGHGC